MGKSAPEGGHQAWVAAWLDRVASGAATMSQRKLSSIEARGGLDRVVEAALERGIHLLQLTDDKGEQLVAASLEPFRILC